MRTHALLIITAGLLVGAGAKEDEAKKESEKL